MKMTEQKLKSLRESYPPGTRIELAQMNDPYAPVPSGTMGSVDFVDDTGSIHMKWDNGRTLALIPGEDSFYKIEQVQSEVTSKFHSELARVLKADGLQTQATDCILTVLSDGKTVCRINEAAEAFLRSDEQSSDLYHSVQATAQKVREYVTAIETAPPLVSEGLGDGYKLLCKFNDTVLAGNEMQKGYQFITWDCDRNGGLNHGHYYDDYIAAKEDFAKRAGLVPSFKLWNTEQLGEIYKAIRYSLENDLGLTVAQEQTLTHIKEHIEYENLDLAEPEHQENTTIHMSMT